MWGGCLDFDRVTATQCASLSTKNVMNRTISTPGEKFITMDLKDLYYVILMEEYEHMRILLSSINKEIIDQYELASIEDNGWIYIEIKKGNSWHETGRKIANGRLKKHLEKYGYE